MNRRSFFTQLSFVSLGAIVLILLLNLVPVFQSFQILTWISFAFFFLFCVLMYFIGDTSAKSANKNNFLQVVMATTFFKMFLCIGTVIVYHMIAKPESKLFAIPFLLVYIIFTAFETYVMMKLSYLDVEKEKNKG